MDGIDWIILNNCLVVAGKRYAFVLEAGGQYACYGVAYSDCGAYPGGGESVSGNGGGSYTTEKNRSLKFMTQIPGATSTKLQLATNPKNSNPLIPQVYFNRSKMKNKKCGDLMGTGI